MNVSELARRVNVAPQDLYDLLPQFGFDIGRRAIKIDDHVAQQVVKQWPRIRREWERQKEKAREAEERIRRAKAVVEGTAQEIELPAIVTVRDFATLLGMPVSLVLQELLRNGILANLNEQIDYATAAIIAEDLGFRSKAATQRTVEEEIAAVPSAPVVSMVTGTSRAPVVVVMGHVDHGKTKLLDSIRSTNIVAGEAGGITQHIGAYQMIARLGAQSSRVPTSESGRGTPDTEEGHPITFIDTPGHEAFTTMRSRGARVADIAILVVAADDGVQPQTKEALKIIQAAKIPFVVAMNKIDKPDANTERVMQELGALGVTSEAWGGKVPFVPVSAKTGEGIPQLLEIVLLIADVERERLLADASAIPTAATVESHVDKNEGLVATLLVQSGTLKVGDVLSVRGAFIGKVRSMRDHLGQTLAAAPPSTPVRILGFKVLPEVGDLVEVSENRKGLTEAKKRVTGMTKPSPMASTSTATGATEEAAMALPIVIRADMLGSLEAVCNEIERLGDASVQAKIIGRGLGNITENDVTQAEAAKGQIFGFGVRAPDAIAKLAREKKVTITSVKIIYELLDAVRAALQALVPEETVREELGTLQVIALFRQEAKWQIVGGRVTNGKIVFDPKTVKVELVRGDEIVATGKLLGMQAGKEDVREVVEGQECGVKVAGIDGIAIGDHLRFVKEEVRKHVIG